jgi:hypothetical protein
MRHIRIDAKTPRRQEDILDKLYREILIDDRSWHYFRDEQGITLRVSGEFIDEVKELVLECGFNYVDEQGYTEDMEYRGTRETFSDLIKAFHLISDLSCRHSKGVIKSVFLERITHQIANHAYMDHFKEAQMLSDMALGRAKVAGWQEELQ